MNGRARTVARRGIQGISIQEEGGNTGEGEQDIDIIYSYVQSSTVCTVEAVQVQLVYSQPRPHVGQ